MLKWLLNILWPTTEPVYGFCKTCERWTETRYIRIYRNRTQRIERQALCADCHRWRWG